MGLESDTISFFDETHEWSVATLAWLEAQRLCLTPFQRAWLNEYFEGS